MTLLTDIGLGIIFAAASSHVARFLRQPLILGYVLGGVLLGTHLGFGLVMDEASIELISEIGLILLLFIIGLEINLRELAGMGRAVFVVGAVQFLVCAALATASLRLLGWFAGTGRFDVLYIGVCLALSSTLVVVKLLHDKFEVNTAAGRLTLGVLVLQDIWAIVFMGLQPNLLKPELLSVLKSFAQGGILVFCAFVTSRYLLSRLFQAAGKSPELILLTSTAWCFLVCGLAGYYGLSKEMGALIAGLSIAAFPYGTDVVSKLAGVRDFFVTLFFVSLGLKVPHLSWMLLGLSFLFLGFVIASRIVSIVPPALLVGSGLRTGLLTAINLAQISEFSLVIAALGLSYGHIAEETQSLILTSMLLSCIVSTYLIHFNDRLARAGLRMMKFLGYHGDESGVKRMDSHGPHRDIVILGCFREGEALVEAVHQNAPDLKGRMVVVDYNPALERKLAAKGFKWVYGDLAHPQTLHYLGIADASVVVCTITDTFLKGTTNRRLLSHLKRLAPNAKIIMTADDHHAAGRLLEGGAHEVMVSPALAAGQTLKRLQEIV